MPYAKSFRRADYSLLQSAVAHVARQTGKTRSFLAIEHPTILALNAGLEQRRKGQRITDAVTGKFGVIAQCIELMARYVEAAIHGPAQEAYDIKHNELPFSPCDLDGWATAVMENIDYYKNDTNNPKYVYWQNLADFVYPLPETGKDGQTLTIGILGDWGTGEPVADAVLQNLMQAQPDLIIHVGDVYYAGTEEECTNNLVAPIMQYASGTPVYTLPGNHEYYSGGAGYYSVLPQLNQLPQLPWARVQQASFFCLTNSWLQLQGMDTGYNAHNFVEDLLGVEPATWLNDSDPAHTETAWHAHQIDGGVAANRRIILLSHHQPYSAYASIAKQPVNPNLLSSFAGPLAAGKISAWLWGHEHICEVYSSPITLPAPVQKTYAVRGRCLGHSAFPVLTSENPYNVVNQDIAKFAESYKLGVSDDKEVFNHGYVVLKLSRNLGQAFYYEVDGGSSQLKGLLFTETLYSTQAAAAP
jgi:hypothetical protein